MTTRMRRGEHVIIPRREKQQAPRERGDGRQKRTWRDELEQADDDRSLERRKGR